MQTSLQAYFSEVPEPPPPSKRITENINHAYLARLEDFIDGLGSHIRNIQAEEVKEMDELQQKLKRIQGRSKKDKEENLRLQFDTRLGRLRRLRKDFRDLERRALDERIHYLNSMLQQKQEQERLKHKLQRLKAIPEETFAYPRKSIFDFTAFVLMLFQVAWIILMGLAVEYRDDPLDNNGYNTRIDDWYSFYTQIAIQVFFAWGMSGTWLKKYAYGSLVFSFMIGVYALQWGFLLNGFFEEVSNSQYGVLDLTIHKLILALVCSTALVVSHGAVLGKIGIFGGEVFFYTIVGVAFWTLNYFICIFVLKASDVGGAMTVHLWGGMYGIGATTCLSRYWDRRDPTYTSDQHPEHTSSYLSDVMAMVGTIFLWILFPAWNAALAPDTSQHRVAINTFLGLTASAVVGFLFSRIVRSKYVEIRDMQSVIFAGGIALGSGHSLVIKPAAALIIGAVAALAALIADVFLHNNWEKRRPHNRLRVFDTKHVFAFHVIPGIIGGIASIIAAVINSQYQYGIDVTQNYFPRGFPRQGGFQTACLVISFVTASLSGYLVGFVLNVLRGKITKRTPGPYLDEHAFILPYDYPKPADLFVKSEPTPVPVTAQPTTTAATTTTPANTPPQ
jgi:ammonium transporter Rh